MKVNQILNLIKKWLHQFSLKKALKPMRLTWWILYGPLFWKIMSPWSYKILRITTRLIFFVFGDAWNFWKLLETFGKFHGNFRKLLSNLLETETSNLYLGVLLCGLRLGLLSVLLLPFGLSLLFGESLFSELV